MKKEKITPVINIEKDIKAANHQYLMDSSTDLESLYDVAIERLKNRYIDFFSASYFYNLGRIHGIREERARRKAANTKQAAGGTYNG